MKPKKHYVTAEITDQGIVFASDEYSCKLLTESNANRQSIDPRQLEVTEDGISLQKLEQSLNSSPHFVKYGQLDDTFGCSGEKPFDQEQNKMDLDNNKVNQLYKLNKRLANQTVTLLLNPKPKEQSTDEKTLEQRRQEQQEQINQIIIFS